MGAFFLLLFLKSKYLHLISLKIKSLNAVSPFVVRSTAWAILQSYRYNYFSIGGKKNKNDQFSCESERKKSNDLLFTEIQCIRNMEFRTLHGIATEIIVWKIDKRVGSCSAAL